MVPQLLGTRILRTRWMGLRSRFPWTRLLWRRRILRRWTRLLPRRLRWRICPRLVPRWLRARWFRWSCPRRWRWIPQWRWPWRRTPIIVAQTCRERDEPGWLPTRPAAFGGDEFCARVVSANSGALLRVLSASGFVPALGQSKNRRPRGREEPAEGAGEKTTADICRMLKLGRCIPLSSLCHALFFLLQYSVQ